MTARRACAVGAVSDLSVHEQVPELESLSLDKTTSGPIRRTDFVAEPAPAHWTAHFTL